MLLLLWVTPGWSAVPATLLIDSDSHCPSAGEIITELTPLLPETQGISLSDSAPRGPLLQQPPPEVVKIAETHATLHVQVRGAERTFSPLPSSCQERARFVAIFISLVLKPPLVPQSAAEPPANKVTSPHVPSAPGSPRFETNAVVAFAPGTASETVPFAAGLGARGVLAFGRSPAFAGSIGSSVLWPFSLHLPAAQVRLFRLPLDASLRWTLTSDRAAWALELGPEVSALVIQAQNVTQPRSALRAELGARGATLVSYRMSSRLLALMGFSASFSPRPYELRLEPGPALGHTPSWWLMVSLGLAFPALN